MDNLGHFLLVWVFWIIMHLRSQEEIEDRKRRGHPITFNEVLIECSQLELIFLPFTVVVAFYIFISWLDLLGKCGSAELMFLQMSLQRIPHYHTI